jgi:hypothetical protein
VIVRAQRRNERLKAVKSIADKDEPFFYMAFVLKGTADQYLDLLTYAKKQNGAKTIYQNRCARIVVGGELEWHKQHVK